MTQRIEVARSLRDSAARLRNVAKTEVQLSAELALIADGMEEDAALLEQSFRDKPPNHANDEAAASPLGFSGQ